MSIIDDVRIKQDLDKEGKYVCDLNHKEEIETRSDIHTIVDNKTVQFIWSDKGIKLRYNAICIIDPVAFMDAAVSWFEYSERYKWKFPIKTVSKEKYIRLVIKELEKLI